MVHWLLYVEKVSLDLECSFTSVAAQPEIQIASSVWLCACAVLGHAFSSLCLSREQVGRENLVGTEHGALLCMMRNLEIERVTLAAMGLGIARCGWM